MGLSKIVFLLGAMLMVTDSVHSYAAIQPHEIVTDGDETNCTSPEHQSPINIETDKVVLNCRPQAFGCISMEGKNGDGLEDLTHTIINKGHDVQVHLDSGRVCLDGGGLPETYLLEQYHFHWGSDNSNGSEHSVNGEFYPMEVHFVYYAESWGSFAEAKENMFGLAVVAFFFEISDHDNPHLMDLVGHLDEIKEVKSNVSLGGFDAHTLLPTEEDIVYGNKATFWQYYGSLTSGDHQESVIWTVFKKPLKISQKQLDKFRTSLKGMNDEHQIEEHLVNNVRPLQELSNRRVYTNNPDGTTLEGQCRHGYAGYPKNHKKCNGNAERRRKRRESQRA